MNRDNMSRAQLIALVKELEVQNAELRERSGGDTVMRRARSFSEGVDALFYVGEPQDFGADGEELTGCFGIDQETFRELYRASNEALRHSVSTEALRHSSLESNSMIEDIQKRFRELAEQARAIREDLSSLSMRRLHLSERWAADEFPIQLEDI